MTDSPTAPLPGELGRGRFGRATVVLHRLTAITAAFALSCLPVLAPALLGPSALATALGVLLLGCVAVSFSAALTAWHGERRATHPAPWSAFWHGYRRNARDVLRAAAPLLVALAVVAVTLGDLGAAGVGPGYGWLLVAIAAGLALVTLRSVVLASFFSFRTRDVWRLACFTLFRRPLATLASVALGLCALGVVWVQNEAVLLLVGGLAARAVLHYEEPVLALVRDDFTHEGRTAPS